MNVVKVIGTPLYQWEIGRKVQIFPRGRLHVAAVHFSHVGDARALVVDPIEENGVITANVPNVLLQSDSNIVVYVVDVSEDRTETLRECVLGVTRRAKPDDYVYTETEVRTYTALEQRIDALEKKPGGSGGITQETDPNVPDWAKEPNKPTYTADEVGALPADTPIPEPYTLPTASPTVKGGVMIGDGLEMDGEKVRVKDMPELIATLTVEKESVTVVISKDVSENSFALKNATVLLTFPDGASLGQVYVGVKEYKWVSFSSDALSNKYLRVHILPIGGGLWTGYTIWSRDLLISSTPTYSVQYCENAGDTISSIAMRFSQKIPVGTTIKVYGVRA